MSYDVGDPWTAQLEVRDPITGALTTASVSVQFTSPSGVVTTGSVTTPSTGVYRATQLLTASGRWQATWTVSGAVTGVETQSAYVRRLGSNVVSVSMVRDRLDKTLTVDDAEIEEMLDAALAEYEEWVGPVSGTVVEKHHGGGTSLILRNANPATITTAVYTGIVYWGYNTAGAFPRGWRNVTITYQVGTVPANHRETIAADVAGYFAATQMGPAGPDEGYAVGNRATPLVLFPRIRALAAPAIA